MDRITRNIDRQNSLHRTALKNSLGIALAAFLFFGVLTLWIPAYWPITVFQVGVFTLAAVSLWRGRHAPPRFAWPHISLLFAVLWGLFQLAAGRTAYAFETEKAIVHWATCLAVVLAGVYLFGDGACCRWFRSAMVWFAFIIAIEATVQTFTSDGKVFWIFRTEYSSFVTGPILYRNHYAAFIEAVLPMALYRALRDKRNSLIYSIIAAAMYASVIAAASRAGIVLGTAEIITVVALLWARGRITGPEVWGATIKIALPLVIFGAVVGYETVSNRFLTEDPMVFRRDFNIASLHMIEAQPVSGVGLGNWPTVYPRYAVADIGLFANQAHNDWLQWTAEGGVPLGIVMAALFLWCLRPAFRSIWGLGVVAVLLHAAVDYPFSRPALASWIFVIVAMLAAQGRDAISSTFRTTMKPSVRVVPGARS